MATLTDEARDRKRACSRRHTRRRREMDRWLTSAEERTRRAVRCSRCGQRVVPPCLTCWTERYVARGCTFDPHDQHPAGLDRPPCIPTTWPVEQVAELWHRVVDLGLDWRQLTDLPNTPPPVAKIVWGALRRYVEAHPDRFAADPAA